MKKLACICAIVAANPALAQGWGNVAKQEEETGFSWTDPLWPAFWMAWTPATFVLFCGIFGAIAVIGILEGIQIPRRAGTQRHPWPDNDTGRSAVHHAFGDGIYLSRVVGICWATALVAAGPLGDLGDLLLQESLRLRSET